MESTKIKFLGVVGVRVRRRLEPLSPWRNRALWINSLAPEGCGCNFEMIIFKLIIHNIRNYFMANTTCPIKDNSTLVQVMALYQFWPKCVSPCDFYWLWCNEVSDHHDEGFQVSVQQGAVSIRKTVLPGMAIPMLKIRRPNGRLIFNMEITIRR